MAIFFLTWFCSVRIGKGNVSNNVLVGILIQNRTPNYTFILPKVKLYTKQTRVPLVRSMYKSLAKFLHLTIYTKNQQHQIYVHRKHICFPSSNYFTCSASTFLSSCRHLLTLSESSGRRAPSKFSSSPPMKTSS